MESILVSDAVTLDREKFVKHKIKLTYLNFPAKAEFSNSRGATRTMYLETMMTVTRSRVSRVNNHVSSSAHHPVPDLT